MTGPVKLNILFDIINKSEIVSIEDMSADGRTILQVPYDLINRDNIDIIYGKHPAMAQPPTVIWAVIKCITKRLIESKCSEIITPCSNLKVALVSTTLVEQFRNIS